MEFSNAVLMVPAECLLPVCCLVAKQNAKNSPYGVSSVALDGVGVQSKLDLFREVEL